MKTYAKLFEDFLEEDELDDILGDTGDGGGEKEGADKEKKKEEKPDPIKKLQDEEKKKEEKSEENFDQYMDKKEKELSQKFDEYPKIKDEIGEDVLKKVQSRDRVQIHNAANELIYLQVKYEKAGDTDTVENIGKIKEIVDDLDRSYTNNKHM
jgi:hypothetical protein